MSLQETTHYQRLNSPNCPKCGEAMRFKYRTPAPWPGMKLEFFSFQCPSCRETVTINGSQISGSPRVPEQRHGRWI
jgi:predicted RNA-binding Zn-ribbon protein involved in translation (DUF1610 family)